MVPCHIHRQRHRNSFSRRTQSVHHLRRAIRRPEGIPRSLLLPTDIKGFLRRFRLQAVHNHNLLTIRTDRTRHRKCPRGRTRSDHLIPLCNQLLCNKSSARKRQTIHLRCIRMKTRIVSSSSSHRRRSHSHNSNHHRHNHHSSSSNNLLKGMVLLLRVRRLIRDTQRSTHIHSRLRRINRRPHRPTASLLHSRSLPRTQSSHPISRSIKPIRGQRVLQALRRRRQPMPHTQVEVEIQQVSTGDCPTIMWRGYEEWGRRRGDLPPLSFISHGGLIHCLGAIGTSHWQRERRCV